MKKIYYFGILFLVLSGAWFGFYYKNNIFNAYNGVGKKLQQFESSKIGDVVNQITKHIFLPAPLIVGGEANEAVLVKSKIIAQTNIQRFNNGSLPPLIENAKLTASAKAKAVDMFTNQYFEHVSLKGVDPGMLVKSFGYEYIVSGENLILGNFKDEKELVQAWMDSKGHRENILNDRFSDIGIAIVKGSYKNQVVWIGVQEFGLPLSVCQNPDPVLKTEIDNNKLILDQLSLQLEAKKEEINNSNSKSKQYDFLVDEYNNLLAQYDQLHQSVRNLIVQYNDQVNNFNQCVEGAK